MYENTILLNGNIALPIGCGEAGLQASVGIRYVQNKNHVPGNDALYPILSTEIDYRF